MSKIDVADAFYQINLNPADSIRMGVLLPSKKGERKLIGFPLVLPMGWTESPLAFCAGTETIADMANVILATNMQSLDVPHQMDVLSETVLDPAKIGISTAKIGISTDSSKIGNINFPMIPGLDLFQDQNSVLVSRTDSASKLVRDPDPKFFRDPKFPRDPKFV